MKPFKDLQKGDAWFEINTYKNSLKVREVDSIYFYPKAIKIKIKSNWGCYEVYLPRYISFRDQHKNKWAELIYCTSSESIRQFCCESTNDVSNILNKLYAYENV